MDNIQTIQILEKIMNLLSKGDFIECKKYIEETIIEIKKSNDEHSETLKK